MANTHHIVIRQRAGGWDQDGWELATKEELTSRRWSATHSARDRMSIRDLLHEDGTAVRDGFDEWDAAGREAWVSHLTYPSTMKLSIRQLGQNTDNQK